MVPRQGTCPNLETLNSSESKGSSWPGTISVNLTLQNALFRGVRDLVPVPSKSRSALEETPGYLEGRLCTHKGHGISQLVANVLGPGENAKIAKTWDAAFALQL